MTAAPVSGDERTVSRRESRQRCDELRARCVAGETLSLADAIEALPGDDIPPCPSVRFVIVAAAAAESFLLGTALGVDPAAPLTRKPIPAGAWHSARLVPGDFEFLTMDVLGGVRLYAVQISLATTEAAGSDTGFTAAEHGGDDASKDDGTPPVVGDALAPIPGAMAAAARWIVDCPKAFDAASYASALKTFGVTLDPSTFTIRDSVDGIDGREKTARGGRPLTLARLLFEAFARKLFDEEPPTRACPNREIARRALDWIGQQHPTVPLPELRTAYAWAGKLSERLKP